MSYGNLRKKKIVNLFANTEILPVIAPGFDLKKSWIKACIITFATGLAFVALAGPQVGFKWEKSSQKGVDIMIALDCSKSMLAQDIKPNRLERAKREIVDLLQMMRSDRAGLVVFTGSAVLQCPLTLDHEAFNIFLNMLHPGFMPTGGTDLGNALNECYNGFEKESDTEKAIILITDGESTTGDVEKTAKELAKKNIKIFCIGVGDTAGAPIPDEKGGFIKDRHGNIILSKVDEHALKKTAELTGGIYVRSVAGDMDLDMIYKDEILETMERKTITAGKKKIWENRFQWFLFPAVILLLIELVLSSKKRVNQALIFIFVFAASLSGVAGSFNAYAKTVTSSVKLGMTAFEEQNYEKAKKYFIEAQLEDPENCRLYYNIGAAAYMNKEYDQAMANFKQALESEDKNLHHDAKYNLANTHYRLGNLDDAIKTYETILKEFPDDKQAEENLEFVKKKREENKKKQSLRDKNKKDKNKKDKNKKDKDNRENREDSYREDDNRERESKSKDENRERQKQQNQESDRQDMKQPQNQNEQNSEKNRSTDPGDSGQESGKQKNQQHEQAAENNRESQRKQADQSLENMLNRLEDKPGKAMMPLMQKQHIEKDW